MFEKIANSIKKISEVVILEDRKSILQLLRHFIQQKIDNNEEIRLNFICTHNSRRSHLSQIWAQTMAFHFNIKNVFCYSGGTEATAIFPKVIETLSLQGFEMQKLSDTKNPVYAVKFAENESPIICFSKTYFDSFNPKTNFAAILTCNTASEECPIVFGASASFPIHYTDPKVFDETEVMNSKYLEKSLEIAAEMYFVFSGINYKS